MSEHIYKHIEVTGTSTASSDDAVRNALAKASESVHGIRWFEVTESRGDVQEGKVSHWQVTIKIGFRIDE